MSSTYGIRPATPDDAEALAAVSSKAFVDTFVEEFRIGYSERDLADFLAKSHSREAFAEWLNEADVAAWIAESNGAIVGYALCGEVAVPHPQVGPNDVELHRLYVLKDWHGTGVARNLMDAAMAWMAKAPAQWLGVWSLNDRAQKFYARYGFEKVGEYDFPVGETLDREFILRRLPNKA